MVARHQKESRQVQARSGNETYYRYLDTDSERLVTSAIDCATGQLSGAAMAEPYPNTHRVPPLKVLYRPEGVFVYTMLQYMWRPLLPKMPQTLMVGNMRVSPKWTVEMR